MDPHPVLERSSDPPVVWLYHPHLLEIHLEENQRTECTDRETIEIKVLKVLHVP